MVELIERVEAKTGQKATIYGTKTALAKLRTGADGAFQAYLSDSDKENISKTGRVGDYYGTPVVEIPQSVNRKMNLC